MDNLSTNRAARKLVELALISFLGACHNGTDVGVLRIHFLPALIIFLCDIRVAQCNPKSGRLGHRIVRISPVCRKTCDYMFVSFQINFMCTWRSDNPVFLHTHQSWLHSPFADLHPPLRTNLPTPLRIRRRRNGADFTCESLRAHK